MTADVAVRSLSGVQKAALVLTTMSTERAAAVLRNLAPEEAAEITAEIARLRSVSGPDAEAAIKAFRAQGEKGASPSRSGGSKPGKAVAETLIHASFEPEQAAGLIEQIDSPGSSAAFSFLDTKSPTEVVRLLQHESPETVAFVLVQLAPDFAAKVLMAHAADRRTDVAQSVATMGTPAPEAAAIVGDVLKRRARGRASGPDLADDDLDAAPQPSVQPLVDIMSHADLQAEDELLAALRARDEGLAEAVRAKMLAFDDVPRVQDRDLQQILRGMDVRELALALKGASTEIADAIKANMSERNRELLADEAAELGRVPKRQVEEARSVLVRAIREFASSSEEFSLKKVHVDAEPGDGAEAAEEPEDEEEYVD